MTAVKEGRTLDTSMGLTPLEGCCTNHSLLHMKSSCIESCLQRLVDSFFAKHQLHVHSLTAFSMMAY